MKIIISRIPDREIPDNFESDLYPVESITFGECEFLPSETEGILFIDQAVEISNSKVLTLWASYDLSTGGMSIFIKEDGVHIFTATLHWDEMTPYLAFCLRDGTYTGLNFVK